VRSDIPSGGDRGLRVQRVEDRLDEQQVDPAGQRLDLLGVRGVHLVERNRPVGGIIHSWGQRQRDVQRPDRAGDESPAHLVRGLARQLSAPQIHLPHQ
jgi:hypothetical protein